jgi:single-stranded-DNA-specific exonuclease
MVKNCRWSIAPPQPLLTSELAAGLRVSPLLSQCLINRGVSTPESITGFLEPRLKRLADPFLLPNMEAAIRRLFLAYERQEIVVLFGDYDVDGVTSVALLTQVLGGLGWRIQSYLPHRLEDGYGLSLEAVQKCLQNCPGTLLLAVDCGSTATATIEWLRNRGVDTLVLDHHQTCFPLPAALAVVNPQLRTDGQPDFRELCSVGLSFKLAHALLKHGRSHGLPGAIDFDLRPLLDLVALGTIADVVPLVGENRILVTAGLERLNRSERIGLQALTKVAGTQPPVGVQEVSYQLAPRLNAAGRLENALQALHLLLAPDSSSAESLAKALDTCNRERQQIERKMADEVIGAVRARFNPETDYVIVEGQLLWHVGGVGIVASRVLREFYRPTLIIGGDGDEWRGSGRSIEGFDLAAALRACSELLTRHGGHPMAAGLSLPPANLDLLRKRLNDMARQSIAPHLLQPALRVDAETTLQDLTYERVTELARLAPFGQGNPPVHLMTRRLTLRRPVQRIGKNQQHLKLWLTDGTSPQEAVWWSCDGKPVPTGPFDLVFCPEINEFNRARTVQLRVLDWRPAE